MLRVAIVEDMQNHALKLTEYLNKYAGEKGENLQITHFQNALNFLEPYTAAYDIVFMDIKMPHMDGMEAARLLREKDESVVLVFVTTMAQYAIRGYEVNAFDFILKPVEYDALVMKMNRIMKKIMNNRDRIMQITTREGIVVLKVRDISYVEVYNHLLIFHTESGNYEANGQLSALEKENEFADFIRPSPSHLVNCSHVLKIGQYELNVAGDSVPISRRKRKETLEKLARVLGGK